MPSEAAMSEAAAPAARVAVALLHHPVYDKNRQVVTTAVTNLDIHDIARSAKTYGLCRYYVVTPVPDQQALIERIRLHWIEGWGAGYNPRRRQALELLKVVPDIDALIAEMAAECGSRPRIVATGARSRGNPISSMDLRKEIEQAGAPFLLLVGTGWGMTDDVFVLSDRVLEPIHGAGDYNHLSVRSAVAIYLDRLFGSR
jgi:hypothetical protein